MPLCPTSERKKLSEQNLENCKRKVKKLQDQIVSRVVFNSFMIFVWFDLSHSEECPLRFGRPIKEKRSHAFGLVVLTFHAWWCVLQTLVVTWEIHISVIKGALHPIDFVRFHGDS